MLTLRLTGVRDYSVFDDGQRIGRIRRRRELFDMLTQFGLPTQAHLLA